MNFPHSVEYPCNESILLEFLACGTENRHKETNKTCKIKFQGLQRLFNQTLSDGSNLVRRYIVVKECSSSSSTKP